MKTFSFRYWESLSHPVEVEAETPEEAESKFYANFEEYVDSFKMEVEDSWLTLCEVEDEDGKIETVPEDHSSIFTDEELSALSDALVQAIANNNRAADMVFGAESVKALRDHNTALAALNTKICNMMK